MKDRFLKALRCEEVDCTPIWIMRQAGRYLPEYQKARSKAGSFLKLCQTPELACEVTLMPIRRFALDAAILFSDILTIPDAMGLGLDFLEGSGPKFSKPLSSFNDFENLSIPDPETELRYVMDTIRLLKRELKNDRPLVGFSGSPWTLACYMVEGGSSRDFSNVRARLHANPQEMEYLLEKLTTSVSLYLEAQIDAGVDAIMIFDSWAGILSTPCFMNFSLKYLKEICRNLKPKNIPIIVFAKGGGNWLESLSRLEIACLGLDWSVDISVAKSIVGNNIAVQGNLDPAVMCTNPKTIKAEAKNLLDKMSNKKGHIFNLGHGITPDVNPDHVEVLIETVHSHSRRLRNE